jgi:hypothetical protein
LEYGEIPGVALYIFILFLFCMIHCNVQAMEATVKFGEASSGGKSPEQAPMEVSDDEQDEALLKLNEDEICEL